ncbi:MAG: hypothetical protein LBV57_03800 [Candidatus Symbiothrix sp.]|nr:hypothetical protein [Candidatus Symbiothrix sp.]
MNPAKNHLFFVCICFCLFSIPLSAQQEELFDGFLFPQYEKGYVILKENKNLRIASHLNYDTFNEKMLFLDTDSSVMELVGEDVLVVVIGERAFLPSENGKSFYESVSTREGQLFVQRKSKEISKGKAAGYGSYSATSAVESLGHIDSSFGTKNLKSDELFKTKLDLYFYLKNGSKFEKFFSTKTLGKLFKGKQADIETFAKENSTNFAKLEDVKKITEYCFSLSK